jgi:hypothetical protein
LGNQNYPIHPATHQTKNEKEKIWVFRSLLAVCLLVLLVPVLEAVLLA